MIITEEKIICDACGREIEKYSGSRVNVSNNSSVSRYTSGYKFDNGLDFCAPLCFLVYFIRFFAIPKFDVVKCIESIINAEEKDDNA